jgi:isoquinoline 1-oxidoreductase alpha subunit
MPRITVNGADREYAGAPDMPLLWWLRDELGMTGTKFGCGAGLCGACTVHLNGVAVRACQTPAAAADGARITTIEGLSATGDHPLQKAWRTLGVPQCGYCQGGQIMQAASLLAETPRPSLDQIDAAMAGNLCRCGTYGRVRAAIRLAAGQETGQ